MMRQRDQQPLNGFFPTSYWQAGDNLHDHAALSLPTDIPAGDYLLLIGLYDQATQQRITGENQQNIWILAELTWDGVKWEMRTYSTSERESKLQEKLNNFDILNC